ncbi:MAG TPA: sigma-54 dependent transcriptional regulator [Thermodesulfovibrionales bacterium]|nr:sigma-54 dependent transcriptional regulator [Thermodesulfovibrionales bacterium]
MEKIVLLTKDATLRKEITATLPRGLSLVTHLSDPGNAIVFYDIDTMKAGDIRALSEKHFVIALTKQKRTELVMEAATFGAYETLQRPFREDLMSGLLHELHVFREEIKTFVPIASPPPSAATCAIVGHSPATMDMCKKLARLSLVEAPVLITGETGTGKELIAESIAQLSSRFGMPFVVVNCAAVPEALLESELFGFEKGSFTGAAAPKEGILRIADKGCVFFDEVGELPLALQGKLLRFLQTQTFYPLGSTKEVQVNVRVISATNRDLSSMVKEGRFREDLYHRLRVTSIHIPPLRERKKDILPLVHFFVNRYRHTAPRRISGVTKAFLRKMLSYDWPGNIRELENVIRSAIALSKTEYLTTHELRELGDVPGTKKRTDFSETLSSALVPSLKEALEKKDRNLYEMIHREVDRVVLDYVVAHTKENQSLAARLLGINRLTLRKKLGILR